MASASVVKELVVPVLGVVVNVVMILAPIKTFIHAETLGGKSSAGRSMAPGQALSG